MYSLRNELNEAAATVRERLPGSPETALILGSGLGFFAEEVEDPVVIPYSAIPHFPGTTVEGHAGRLVYGIRENRHLIIAQGRQHFYEGYSLDEVTFATRLFHKLGASNLLITNAAGIANPEFAPGQFMTIINHFPMTNRMLSEAYRGVRPAQIWNISVTEQLRDKAIRQGIPLHNGTYAWVTGPSYETPAEVKYLRNLGADAIGMSTVPEAIAATQLNMRVLGISCLTNYATGLSRGTLSHSEVSETAKRSRKSFAWLVRQTLLLLDA